MKTNGIMRTIWRGFLLTGFVMAFWFLEFEGNEVIFTRLAHQIFSLGETLDKMAQSIPKFEQIIKAARAEGNLFRNLCKACEAAWNVAPMGLHDVKGFDFLTGGSRSGLPKPDGDVEALTDRYTMRLELGPFTDGLVISAYGSFNEFGAVGANKKP
jgi:hypothetical protein